MDRLLIHLPLCSVQLLCGGRVVRCRDECLISLQVCFIRLFLNHSFLSFINGARCNSNLLMF